MKILALTNLPSPYRVEFFNELGKYAELTVMFERHTAGDRDDRWKTENDGSYKEIYLEGRLIGSDSSLSTKAVRYIRQKKYDILFIMGYVSMTSIFAITYCRLNKIAYILNSDGAVEKPINILKKMLKTFLIGGAQSWLCSGSSTVEYLQKYGAKEERSFVYPFTSLREKDILSHVLTKDDKSRIRHLLGINEARMILSIGQFIPRKGFDILLNACAYLPESVGVYIIGGEPTEEYKVLIEKLKLCNVHFMQFMPKEELKSYYSAADIFVLPTREDVWGLVINEAMAYGLPVITTDKCMAGVELINNDENGFLVPVGDALQLAESISQMLSDSNTVCKMSEANLMKIKTYTIEEMARRHFEIFESLA